MIKTLKKVLVIILVLLMLNNFFVSNISFASGSGNDPVGTFIETALGTVVGLLTWPIRLVALGAAWAVDTLVAGIAYSQGTSDAHGNLDSDDIGADTLTPFDIFFNKVALIDVNFFNIPNDGTIISNMRISIASWYYIMRNIAAAILLCILIYVGIRMAISTIATDKAMYKKMLVDWITSFALIFLIQYIIVFTLNINSVFIGALSAIDSSANKFTNVMKNIKTSSLGASADAIASTIIYCMVVAQTLGLLISYIQRMLKLAFLVIISPLITLTYSIDKMGDGKAQALGTWLKEFIFTVLIQPFHCVIYMAFISMSFSILDTAGASNRNNLAGAVIAVLCIKFTKEGEKILGKIFKFSEHTSDTSLAVGMAASAMALSKAKNIGKGTRNAVNGLKNVKGSIGNSLNKAKIDMKTAKNFFGGGMSLAEAKDTAIADVTAENAAKMERRNAKKYKTVAGTSDQNEVDSYNKATADLASSVATIAAAEGVINGGSADSNKIAEAEAKKAEAEQQKAEAEATLSGFSPEAKKRIEYQNKLNAATTANIGKGMSPASAAAHARAQLASETREDNIRNNPKGINDRLTHAVKYNKVRGTINKAKQFYNSSEFLKEMGGLGKATIAAGLGTFVGSATYGATGNLFNSMALGTATYKGTQEFMKSSTSNLTNNISQLLQGGGTKNATQAGSKLNEIMSQSGLYEDAANQINEIFKEIEKAFEKAGAELSNSDKGALKSSITNTIDKELKANPSADNNAIKQKVLNSSGVSSMLSKYEGMSGVNTSALESGLSSGLDNMSDFKRNAAIYDTMKQGGNIGVDADTLVQKSIEQFSLDTYYATSSSTSETTDIKETTANIVNSNDSQTETIIGELSIEDAKKVEDRLESELDKMKQEVERYAGTSGEEDRQAMVEKIEDKYQQVYEGRLEKEIQELTRQSQEYLAASAANTQADLQEQYDTILRDLQNQWQAKLREIDKLPTGSSVQSSTYRNQISDWNNNNNE